MNQVIRYARLSLPFDVNAAQTELLSTGREWQAHLNRYHYTGAWEVLPLRSPGGKHDNPVPDLMGEGGYADTLYMDQFPSVKKLTKSFECPVMSVRFLNLKAGAVIKKHTDPQLAFEKGEARLHFPVFTNPDVEFYSEEERIYLNEGECWYLNANLPHRVSNNSPNDRIHLVIDCKVNEWLTNQIVSSSSISYKKEVVDDNLLNMIRHLRWQNTEQSNKMADEFEKKVKRLMAEDTSI
jgi:quercetin dioxygenase-like cupin family protein